MTNWLLDKEVIKNLIQQLKEKEVWFEGINLHWPAWKYYGYQGAVDWRNGTNYLIIFLLDDNNPKIIGVITVYPFE